ncbi:MAG TPA: hypothetical protein VIU35_16215 [Chitinophagaceae bacterium]
MEVHAHSHTARKKWTHYFWEFLMLFLAVFCGFLAEYQLEHKIEKDRTKIFIKNLLEDLRTDTATFKSYARDNKIRAAITDSLMYLLKGPERKTKTTRIYYLARILTLRSDFLLPNERTYEEMKFSGQLRLIKNQEVSSGISKYYNSLKRIKGQNDRIGERTSHYFLSADKLFDAEVFLKIAKEQKEPEDKSIQLLSEDPKVINELLTRVQYFSVTCLFAANFGLESCKEAERLIELIKKEYHLE